MSKKKYFHSGGSLPPDHITYIEREADREALIAAKNFDSLHIIAPRFMGKTSFLKHLIFHIEMDGWRCAYVNMGLLTDSSKKDWYATLGKELTRQLGHNNDPEIIDQIDLRNYLLNQANLDKDQNLAIFLDEIEATCKPRDIDGKSFSDTFFSTLRTLHGEFFLVTAGAAYPNDLIVDKTISPFNVVTKIELNDYTKKETFLLTDHLRELQSTDGEVHNVIYNWTNGHPYLTYRICTELEKRVNWDHLESITIPDVDDIVENILINRNNPQKRDSALLYIENRIKSLSSKAKSLFGKLQNGKKISIEEENNKIIIELNLTGIIKNVNNQLVFRNLIYEEIFKKNIDNNIENHEIHILHLSDVHLKEKSEVAKYLTPLKRDLIKYLKIKKLEYLIISGDIGNESTQQEYEAAFDFIEDLSNCFGFDFKRLIIVPGNHDLNRDLSEDGYRFVHKSKLPTHLDKSIFIPAGEVGALRRDEELYQKRFENFSNHFYKKLFGIPYPLSYDEQAILQVFPENEIVFLALNSCWEIDHWNTQRAGINIDALSKALDLLVDDKYDDWLKIAIWHHPVTGSDSMKNVYFLQQLANHSFQICMHGHIHEAIENYFHYDKKCGVHIIGAGTFGAPAMKQITGIPLQYQLLTYNIESHILKVETRKKEKLDGSWVADARWQDLNNPLPWYTIDLNLNRK